MSVTNESRPDGDSHPVCSCVVVVSGAPPWRRRSAAAWTRQSAAGTSHSGASGQRYTGTPTAGKQHSSISLYIILYTSYLVSALGPQDFSYFMHPFYVFEK